MKFHENYRKLAAATLPPTDHSELMLNIFSKSISPEDAAILVEMPSPRGELAAKFGLSEKEVAAKEQYFMMRGMAHPTSEGVAFYKEIALLRDEMLTSAHDIIGPEIRELWRQYYDTTLKQELVDWFVTTDPPMLRIIPLPNAVPEGAELMPWEDINYIIEAHKKAATARECCCRSMVEACDAALDVCIQFGGRADYAMNRGAAERINLEQVKALADKAEAEGLVPMVANIANVEALEYLCYCCGCCCVVIEPLKNLAGYAGMAKGLAKSRFEAGVDQQDCISCQKCAKHCPFDAISMVKIPGQKNLKAWVDPEKCWGCGACVGTCKPESINLKCVRPPEHIPSENPYLIL